MNKKILGVISAGVMLALTACGKYSDRPKGETSTSGGTVIACDETFENVMQDEIEVFEYVYPNVDVLPYYLNETACIDSMLNFKINTIVVSRELNESELKRLRDNKKRPKQQQIAVDAIALIVNKDNPIDILSVEEIKEILTGEVTEWNSIDPAGKGKISVVFDNAGSSTVNYMRNNVTEGKPFGENVYAQGSCPKVIDAVRETPGAIGIIGVSWLTSDLSGEELKNVEDMAKESTANDTITMSSSMDENDRFNSNVKVLKVRENDKIQAYKPYQFDIYNGDYPFYRSMYMITVGEGGMPSHGFYSFVTSPQGQKLILTTGILPAIKHNKLVTIE